MKKNRIIELVVKVAVAALTAFLTALGTTSCMGWVKSPAGNVLAGLSFFYIKNLRTFLSVANLRILPSRGHS